MHFPEPRYFDAHGHPHFPAYGAEQGAVIERALAAGTWVTAVGTTLATSRDAVHLAERYDRGVYAAVGIHPTHAVRAEHDDDELGPAGCCDAETDAEPFDANAFAALAASPKVVAVGECGLDYFRAEPASKEPQEKMFRAHIELATRVGKPLMLHVRSSRGDDTAYRDALSILADYPGLSADFHFFSGSWAVAKDILDAGFHLSFDGPITFARDYDEVIRNTPLDRMMAETDCPYAAPVPHRGKQNEPAFVSYIVEAIARIRGAEVESVRAALLATTRTFFGV